MGIIKTRRLAAMQKHQRANDFLDVCFMLVCQIAKIVTVTFNLIIKGEQDVRTSLLFQ